MLLLVSLFPEPDPVGRIGHPALKLLQPLSSYGQDHHSHYSKDLDQLAPLTFSPSHDTLHLPASCLCFWLGTVYPTFKRLALFIMPNA
jgi:hypothetical protein